MGFITDILRLIQKYIARSKIGIPVPKHPGLYMPRRGKKTSYRHYLPFEVYSPLIRKKHVILFLLAAILIALLIVSISFYNALTRYQQDVIRETAQINSLLQRRHNISVNLARTVRDYAVHEQGVFKHVAEMRPTPKGHRPDSRSNKSQDTVFAEKPIIPKTTNFVQNPWADGTISSNIGDTAVNNSIAGLFALAERYPDLKLSENFRTFMAALVETEKDICAARFSYSESVRIYAIKLMTFPGNFFGFVYGFKPSDYYKADLEAQEFKPIEQAVTRVSVITPPRKNNTGFDKPKDSDQK